MRTWLAPWLAAADELGRTPRGRPLLRGTNATRDASWSHSGERMVLVLADHGAVGVDLERLHPRPRALQLAQRYFDAAEAAWLATLDGDARARGFLRLWCAKEAVLKAHGHGLSFGLHRLRFDVPGEAAPQLAACDAALGHPTGWQLVEWVPAPGFHATLAWTANRAAIMAP